MVHFSALIISHRKFTDDKSLDFASGFINTCDLILETQPFWYIGRSSVVCLNQVLGVHLSFVKSLALISLRYDRLIVLYNTN